MSWVTQYLLGFKELGQEVHFVEKAGYPNACFNPLSNIGDCTYGFKVVKTLLDRFGINKLCFVDAENQYYGLSQGQVESAFASADLFVDRGTHGNWLEEAQHSGIRILINGEPGFTQMKMQKRLQSGEILPEYDFYYTTGQNIGTDRSTAPTAGRDWRWIFHPVARNYFSLRPSTPGAPFTTVMNWQSYEPLEFNGITCSHKGKEFAKFMDLFGLTDIPLELAVSVKNMPNESLKDANCRIRNAHDIMLSYDLFIDYV